MTTTETSVQFHRWRTQTEHENPICLVLSHL